MQQICPTCGEPVPAEKINIQEMVAVCPACASVFKVTPPEPDASTADGRKVKPPSAMVVEQDEDDLSLAFRTNFRLDQNEAFLTSLAVGMVLTFVTFLTFSGMLDGEVPLLVALGFALGTLAAYYPMALVAFNRTHIEMDAHQLHISRRPLPEFFRATEHIGLGSVADFHFEETLESQREGYDTPRYRVWAEMHGGHRTAVVSDVTLAYAQYITQALNAQHTPVAQDAIFLDDDVPERLIDGETDAPLPLYHEDGRPEQKQD